MPRSTGGSGRDSLGPRDANGIGTLWQSADGDGYSLDMSGFAPGAISQTFATTFGYTYATGGAVPIGN